MSSPEVAFTALETNEIFEKNDKEIILNKMIEYFGAASLYENKSGNTTIGGQTKWILEKKYVWKVPDLSIFLQGISDKQKLPNSDNFDQIFKHRIETVYVVGLECDELPYFQLVVYIQLSLKSTIPIIVDSYRLIQPFQKFLQNLNGLSNKAYEMSTLKPRFHTHHIVNSSHDLAIGIKELSTLLSMQKQNDDFEVKTSKESKNIRELYCLSYFGLPTVLSAINFDGGVLSFITHHEQFGGGGELQSCGITFVKEPQVNVCIPEFEKQGIEKEIKMFSPNTNVFFSVMGGINLHLFLTGLTTWLAYFEITRQEMSMELERQRENIQKLLNNDKMSKLDSYQNSISKTQGNYASMGILLDSVKNNVIDQIDELSLRKGVLGITEIPIPQKEHNWISSTLINRVGGQAYVQLISTMIKNNFSSISKKLSSVDSPTNKMTNFINNQTSVKLQKTVKTSSIIQIILAIVIGFFTFVSVKQFFGL